jgi:hypothetical protein
MITAKHIPTGKTVEITMTASDGRYFVSTLDNSMPFTRFTNGGPANYGWAVVHGSSLTDIALVTIPCPHTNTDTTHISRMEQGEATVRELTVCKDCGAEVSNDIAGLASEMELQY